MPAVARGKFFFSMSLQMSQIFVIRLFVALMSFSYISSPRSVRRMKNTRAQKVIDPREEVSATMENSSSYTSCPRNEAIPACMFSEKMHYRVCCKLRINSAMKSTVGRALHDSNCRESLAKATSICHRDWPAGRHS